MSDLSAVLLGLGANLGDRRRNLALALRQLEPLVRVEAVSSLYESDPVGPAGQPAYLNAACRAVTGLRPRGLMRLLQEIEHEIGRRREERWGPRPIDVDLLLYGDLVIDSPDIVVPHPELHRRPFVLVPLAEIAADVSHPALDRTIGAIASEVGGSGVRLVAGPGWERAAVVAR